MRRAVRACLRDDATCSVAACRGAADSERDSCKVRSGDGQADGAAAVVQRESRAATAEAWAMGERGGQARMGKPGQEEQGERLEGSMARAPRSTGRKRQGANGQISSPPTTMRSTTNYWRVTLQCAPYRGQPVELLPDLPKLPSDPVCDSLRSRRSACLVSWFAFALGAQVT
jgi:hypothetical protein